MSTSSRARALASPVSAVLRDGRVVELGNHTLLMARSGTEVPITDSAAPLRDARGEVSGVVLVFSDQTASHAARRRLEESEERLRLALRAARQGLYDLNVQTGEATVSPEYATMLDLDPATFRETNAAWIARLHPDDRDRVARAVPRLRRWADARVSCRVSSAYSERRLEVDPLVGKLVSWTPDGQPLRMLGTHTDITDRKAAEDRIRRVSQLYATLSQCNLAIVRSSNDGELFSQVCRDAVVFGEMTMAWVGWSTRRRGWSRPWRRTATWVGISTA